LSSIEAHVSAAEFHAIFDEVCTWDRWGEGDDRGALHDLTTERIAAAGRLVRRGVSVTLSQRLRTEPRMDSPEPADHHMTMLADEDIGLGSVHFAKDYMGLDYHNPGHSHIDAFCHVAYQGSIYGGTPSGSITPDGAEAGSIEVLKDGLVGRGVLLDVPRLLVGHRQLQLSSTLSAPSIRPKTSRTCSSVGVGATAAWVIINPCGYPVTAFSRPEGRPSGS
jgi:hypothetical protein